MIFYSIWTIKSCKMIIYFAEYINEKKYLSFFIFIFTDFGWKILVKFFFYLLAIAWRPVKVGRLKIPTIKTSAAVWLKLKFNEPEKNLILITGPPYFDKYFMEVNFVKFDDVDSTLFDVTFLRNGRNV